MALSDSLYLSLATALLVAFLLAVGLLYSGNRLLDTDFGPYKVSVSGERYAVSDQHLRTLCLGKDCVPPVDEPVYTGTADPELALAEDDMVIGVVMGSAAYAFPRSILQMHHIVNTRLDGTPVAVTYSPHSGHVAVFNRSVGGRVLTFGNTGKLFNANLVMYDQESETFWSQARGTAIIGEQVPQELDRVEAGMIRWGVWRRAYPDTRVLSRNTSIFPEERYATDVYYGYRTTPTTPVERTVNQPKDIVHGIAINGDAVAYREVHIKDFGLISDRVGDIPIVVVQDERTGLIRGFSRQIAGTARDLEMVNRTLTTPGGSMQWGLDGTPLTADTPRLEPVHLKRMYWFAWNLFHPDTDRYRPG